MMARFEPVPFGRFNICQNVLMIPTGTSNFILIILNRFEDINNLFFSPLIVAVVEEKA